MRASVLVTGVTATFAALAMPGCGPAVPRTHPVQGKVVLPAGDPGLLAGVSAVELELATDPKVKAHGVIQGDGSFTVRTTHEGRSLNGAREGRYLARVVLTGEDDEIRKVQMAKPFHPRYYDFKTSRLTIDVPPRGEVLLTLAKK